MKYKPDEKVKYDLKPDISGIELHPDWRIHEHGDFLHIEKSISGMWKKYGKELCYLLKKHKRPRNTPQRFYG